MSGQPTNTILRVDNLLLAEAGKPVSLSVERGEVVCLAGQMASGKSVLLETIAGVRKIRSGEVSIDKKSLAGLMKGRLAVTGLLPQTSLFRPRWTVEQHLWNAASNHCVPRKAIAARVEATLLSANVQALRARRAGELSRGQAQWVALAMAMVHDPVVLLLDEAEQGMDSDSRQALAHLLHDQARLGKAIIVAGSQMAHSRIAFDRLAIMRAGQIVAQGPLRDLLRLAGTRRTVEVSVLKFRDKAAQVLSSAPGHWTVADQSTQGLGSNIGPLVYSVEATDAQLAQSLLLLLKSGIPVLQFSQRNTNVDELAAGSS